MDSIFQKILLISLCCFCFPVYADNEAPRKTPAIALESIWDGKPVAGHKMNVTIRLRDAETGNTLTPDNLQATGRYKIHLLVVDPTFTDFHHLHAEPSTTPYAFNFSFTPKISSSYKLLADITPASTGKEQFISGWIGDSDYSFVDRKVAYTTAKAGYIFNISFDAPPKAGIPVEININVTDSENKPATWQIQMPGWETRIVETNSIIGFYDDQKNVITATQFMEHRDPFQTTEGPDIKFNVQPPVAGYIKLFVQLNINNKDIIVPFSFFVSQ